MYRSWFTPLARVAAPLALATLAACSSDLSTGTTGGLTTAQRTALQNLFNNTSVQQAIAGGVSGSPFSLGLGESATFGLNSLGSITFGSGSSTNNLVPARKLMINATPTTITGPTGSYQAFGAQLVVTDKVSSTESYHIVWTGFVAVDNLTTPTVLITAGVYNTGLTTAPTSIAAKTFGDYSDQTSVATGAYVTLSGSAATVYFANSGTIAVSSASFSGNASCPAGYVGGQLTACSYATGTLQGSFGFTAVNQGTGNTVTVPSTSFNVPSGQTSISIDETLAQ